MVRVPGHPGSFWNKETQSATPEKWDETILEAHRYGLTPMLLFEYYTRHHLNEMSLDEFGNNEVWVKIGRAFAERFGPNSEWYNAQGITDWCVTFYSAVNEPMWKENNPQPISPESYKNALEGLADGVHAVSAELRVSPGGYQEVPLFQNTNPYVKAVAPLYNAGKLSALDIHRYWDDKHIPMQGSNKFSLQSQFDLVKKTPVLRRTSNFTRQSSTTNASKAAKLRPMKSLGRVL